MFWHKSITFRRLHVIIGRNDWIYRNEPRPASASLCRVAELGTFITLRVKTHYLNIDLT